MGNQIIQSIKTIAQSLVDKAGYDKTRGGFIVGVNSVTNTYSVKVDGVTYPTVRAVDGATYNVGDVIKVVIPCNQATQMYISSSVLSDNSLGNKIANATTLAEDAGKLGLDNQLEIKKVSDVANSKNKTFRQDTAPTEGMSSGDVWIDTSDNNTLYVYDGTQWVFSGGGNGQDGLNNATILLYKRGATAPEKPTADLTYTFADASLSPISALNGWTQGIPEIDGNPCWVIAATASATTATDTIGVSEWSTQIKFVEDGAQGATGLNQATIFLYSRTTSTKPSFPTTYTFASGVLSPLPSGWSRSVPTNNGDPCYVTTTIAIGRGSDTTITADAWSDPTVLVENGADGYSPTVSTGTSSDGSTTITVTNKDGSTTTELVDGTAREDATNAAKVATNYIHSDSTNGLVVNNNQTVGVGYDIQLKADGSNTGMNIRQDGEILASFLQNSVSLGKNSINSKVGMCGDKGGVSASFGYYVDSVSSNNAEMGSTLSFDFNETTFKNKVGQTTGFYEFTYTSAGGWELFDPVNDTSYAVTLSQYGITMKTPTSSIKDHAGITINYVLDGSVKFYNADISNPVRKLELEMAENPSSSESDYANITIERQSGTYASGDGKEHSIITMMTLHEFANVATLQLFDDEISLDATHLHLTSTHGEGSIRLNGDTNINGELTIDTALSIKDGGTGAASLAVAQENLGIKAISERIDNLILGTGTSPVEVQDARLSSDGTRYPTLKSRLDAENSELKSDLGKSLDWNKRAESKGFNRIIPIGFYIGERASSGGAINKNSTTRCTTDYFEVKNKKFTVKNDLYNSNVKYAVWCWDENHNKVGGAISNGGWITVESYDFTVLSDTAKYFTLHIAHNDESAFTEISTIDAGMNVFDGEFKIPFELRTHESDNARLFSPYAFEIDTASKTMKCNGTFYLSYGFKNVANVPFDISNLDLSQHGVFYYDIPENKIKWATKSSLNNADTSNYIALGDNWTNTYGYVINLQTESTIYIDGIKVDKSGFDGKYADKKWLFDGDSICYGRTTSGNIASVPFPKQIMKRLGGKSYNNVAVPGACVCVESGNGVTDMVENAVNRNYSAYSYIVMNGGTNDYAYAKEIGNIDDDTNTTFYGAWNIIINKIFSDNKRAKVVLITPLFRNYGANSSGYVFGNAYDIPNHIGCTLSDYCDAIVNIGKKYNIPVFDSRYNSPVNVLNYTATLATDGENKYLHPNDTTYVDYGNRIASFIESNF